MDKITEVSLLRIGHRHSLCADTFSNLADYVWVRLMRWGKRRHPEKSGIWITNRYFGRAKGSTWAFMDKSSGKSLIRLNNDIQTYGLRTS